MRYVRRVQTFSMKQQICEKSPNLTPLNNMKTTKDIPEHEKNNVEWKYFKHCEAELMLFVVLN